MKRILLLLLAALLLVGCSGQDGPEGSTGDTTLPVPTGIYMPQSQAEQQSGGALRAYGITGSRVLALESGVAVVDEQGKLTMIDREEGVIQTTYSGLEDLRAVSGNSVFYYDTAVHEYDLKTAEKTTWELPQELVGNFAIGTQTREIYYCTPGQIFALHMDTGLTRLLKQHSYDHHSIMGAYFGGKVIAWETDEGISYLSSDNGVTLREEDNILELQTQGDAYMALRMDGIVEQKIFGTLDGQTQQLNADTMILIPAFSQQGAAAADIAQSLQLSFYDLTTGKKTAAVAVSQEDSCLDIVADGEFIWVLTENALYRWDISKSAVSDETVWTSAVWTAEAPDAAGMAQCTERIEQLQKTYGVKLHIGMDAVENAGELSMVPEHQVQTIGLMLDELELYLGLLPEGFLKSTVKTGWVRLCLVREVEQESGFVRYWHDGDCYIAISLNADMQEAFLAGLGGAVDSHILGNSRDLEYWNDLNPKDFAYTYGETAPEEYAEYIPAYFADEASMTYASEDRARIFYYAMTEGNEELFSQTVMQQKLKLLCEGIRESYDLKKHTEEFLWEQYLEESLAYTDK